MSLSFFDAAADHQAWNVPVEQLGDMGDAVCQNRDVPVYKIGDHQVRGAAGVQKNDIAVFDKGGGFACNAFLRFFVQVQFGRDG